MWNGHNPFLYRMSKVIVASCSMVKNPTIRFNHLNYFSTIHIDLLLCCLIMWLLYPQLNYNQLFYSYHTSTSSIIGWERYFSK